MANTVKDSQGKEYKLYPKTSREGDILLLSSDNWAFKTETYMLKAHR